MKEKVLEIINQIRASKDLTTVLTLKASDDLRNDLDLTSFDLAELTVRIEDEFDIEVPDEDIRNFITVADVINYIKKQNWFNAL